MRVFSTRAELSCSRKSCKPWCNVDISVLAEHILCSDFLALPSLSDSTYYGDKRLLNLFYTVRHTHVAEKSPTFKATRQRSEIAFVQ
jgi:hypothetical protein